MTPRWNILVSAPYFVPVIDQYRSWFDDHGMVLVIAPVKERLSEDELIHSIGSIDGVICGDDRFTKRVFESAPRLKVISKWGTGIDSIEQEAARSHGVQVFRTPNAFTVPVSDSALGFMLSFARNIHSSDAAIKNGTWLKIPGRSLAECTLGIIGVGNIGQAVAHRASAFSMKILGNDIREIPQDVIRNTGLVSTPLETLLKESDFISLHCDLNPTSRHLLSTAQFALMKPTAVVINTARGPVIDEVALIQVLMDKKIAGAGLDVFEEEPLSLTSPLRQNPNVLLSAHNTNSSPRAWHHVHEQTLQNLLKGLES